jgi:hypothetical protein
MSETAKKPQPEVEYVKVKKSQLEELMKQNVAYKDKNSEMLADISLIARQMKTAFDAIGLKPDASKTSVIQCITKIATTSLLTGTAPDWLKTDDLMALATKYAYLLNDENAVKPKQSNENA